MLHRYHDVRRTMVHIPTTVLIIVLVIVFALPFCQFGMCTVVRTIHYIICARKICCHGYSGSHYVYMYVQQLLQVNVRAHSAKKFFPIN